MVPKQITICFCTYRLDFDLLMRALVSINQRWDHSCILEIIIVLNDDKEALDELVDIVNLFSNTDLKIRVVLGESLQVSQHYNWNTQQTFKLLVAREVKTDWYIIYDCKDFYLLDQSEKITTEYYFTNTGKAVDVVRTGRPPGGHFFEKQYQNAYAIWKLTFDSFGQHTKVTTPFVCKTSMMLDLIEELKIKFPACFENLFLLEMFGVPYITEFTVISAYLEHKNLWEELYIEQSKSLKSIKRLLDCTSSNKFLRRNQG